MTVRRNIDFDARRLAIGFAIFGNILVALAAFPLVDIIALVHGLRPTDIQAERLVQAAYLGVFFCFVPLVALLLAKWVPTGRVVPLSADPVYTDITSTIHLLTGAALLIFTAAIIVLSLAGLTRSEAFSGLLQAAFVTAVTIYIVLIADGRKVDPVLISMDRMVAIAIVLFCVFMAKREMLLLVIPLLLRDGRDRIDLKWLLLIMFGAATLIAFVMVLRENLDFTQTAVRILGSELKFLERFSLNFFDYGQCYGPAALLPAADRGSYAEFYEFIRDPLNFGPVKIWWDSANLLDRLNYGFCSVPISFAVYFFALFGLFLFEKKLNDIRFFRVAMLIIIFAFEGFHFYNLPMQAALVLLALGGIVRVLRPMADVPAQARLAAGKR